MSSIVVLHSLTGTVIVCAGTVALSSRKGSTTHVFAGRLFARSIPQYLVAALGVFALYTLSRWRGRRRGTVRGSDAGTRGSRVARIASGPR